MGSLSLRGDNMTISSISSAISNALHLRSVGQLVKIDKNLSAIAVSGGKNSNYSPPVYISREESMAMTSPTYENNDVNMGNISTLDYKAAFDQYNFVETLVESGRIDNVNFRGFKGAEQAESTEQYLFWLQSHMQEISGGEVE
jgi:hypothetical protein